MTQQDIKKMLEESREREAAMKAFVRKVNGKRPGNTRPDRQPRK